jgi:hypothetical protein
MNFHIVKPEMIERNIPSFPRVPIFFSCPAAEMLKEHCREMSEISGGKSEEWKKEEGFRTAREKRTFR